MPRFEQEKIDELRKKSKREQIRHLRQLYVNDTPWLAEGSVWGGSAFARGGFKSTHFPLELVQNADDAGAKTLRFEVDEENEELLIFDDGQGFDVEGVVAVCQQGRSPKDPRQQIGFMGVGFKSIFEVCEKVKIHSGGYHFAFEEDDNEEGIPGHMIPKWTSKRPPTPDTSSDDSEQNYTTTVVGSIKSLSAVEEALSSDNFSPSVFLFLNSLNTIRIRTRSDSLRRTLHGGVEEDTDSVAEARSLYLDSDNVKGDPENEIDNEDLIEVRKTAEGDEEERWVVFRDIWDIDSEIPRPQMRQELDTSDLFVALRLDDEDNLTNLDGGGSVRISPVHSYLPLKQLDIDLDFLIHAAFDLDPAREGIKSGTEWNERAADAVRTQCLHAVLDVVSDHSKWWRQSHLLVPESQSSDNVIVDRILDRFREDLQGTAFVRDTAQETRVTPNGATVTTDSIQQLLKSSEIEDILKKKPVHPDQEEVMTRLEMDDTVSLVDILQQDEVVNVLQNRADEDGAGDWFSKLYRLLASESEASNIRPVRKALANKVILTESGDIVEGRIKYYEDEWRPFLPPDDGFEEISLQRASTVVDLVSEEVLDDRDSDQSVTAFFEQHGAETATAGTVMAEIVTEQDIGSISKSTCVKVLDIFASGGENVDNAISRWLQALEFDAKNVKALRELVSDCADGISFTDCLDWLSGRWTSLSESEKRSSILLSKEAFNGGERNAFDFLRLPTEEGVWETPENLLLSSPYGPAHDYESTKEQYPSAFHEFSLSLIDGELKPEGDESDVWRNFLTHIGAGNETKVNRLAGRVGELFVAQEQFGEELQQVTDGADFKTSDGTKYIEVKSTKSSTKHSVELQNAQVRLLRESIDHERFQYMVYPVVEALDERRISPRPIEGENLFDNQESIAFDIEGL